MGRSLRRIGIAGAGAWGTALAAVARRAGREVVLQAHEPEVADSINRDRVNALYLPGVGLDPGIRATRHLHEAADADAVILAVPAQHMRSVCRRLAPSWRAGAAAVVCAKGIEQETLALMSEVVAQTLPGAPVAVLSGPTFAEEVARGLPTAVTLAAADGGLADTLSQALGDARFRIYTSDDPVGTQIGGAVKNVLAIACGVVEGRGLGDNARAALITRGLAEMMRLGVAKGARPATMMGLSGLGDLTLTCNGARSRNFSLGVALGRGERLDDVMAGRRSVAEGVFTASSLAELARRLAVEMPISTAVDRILNHFADIDETVAGLLARPFKAERG
jgi:glycerol-3-phosphate dehydrogenase (NAD(P)+)